MKVEATEEIGKPAISDDHKINRHLCEMTENSENQLNVKKTHANLITDNQIGADILLKKVNFLLQTI